MTLNLDSYARQRDQWPRSGRHILAQFDADSVVVYQAFSRSIGCAAESGKLGEGFRLDRMSWVKPNFLWMMYRSGWGTKENQEVTLGLRVRRTFFDGLLAAAVPSTWDAGEFPTPADWSKAVARSAVRVQWDPDHNPAGGKLARRAVQLGLRGDVLEAFGRREVVEVLDLTAFVAEQRERLATGGVAALLTPRERVYRPADPAVAAR